MRMGAVLRCWTMREVAGIFAEHSVCYSCGALCAVQRENRMRWGCGDAGGKRVCFLFRAPSGGGACSASCLRGCWSCCKHERMMLVYMNGKEGGWNETVMSNADTALCTVSQHLHPTPCNRHVQHAVQL